MEERTLADRKLHPKAVAAVRRAKRSRARVFAAVFAVICFAALTFASLSFANGRFVYGVLYIVCAIISAMVTIVRINTVYPPFIAADSECVYMQTWNNRAAACPVDNPVPLVREFLPAKTVRDDIPIKSISRVLIGTKNYLKRQCANDEPFLEQIKKLERSRVFRGTNAFAAIELMYIACSDGTSYFMSVQDFDADDVARVLAVIEKENGEVEITCNDQKIRRARLRVPTVG